MSPTGGARSYWTCGGSIVGRCGPLSMSRALALLQFYAGEALTCEGAGDALGAAGCLRLASDLADALLSAAEWARCASPSPLQRSCET